jgi:2-C-methyl-D-erythritol 2,4-cyclodiphosphate synthase
MLARIGYGEDAHRLAAGRELWIGGVRLESEHGAVAHSDGDVLLHAVADALLSAFALGDIGALFPDTQAQWKDMPSSQILDTALGKIGQYKLKQISAVVTLDWPKLGVHRITIAQSVANLTGLPEDCVGLTFKTSEQLAPGHIQCRAVVWLEAV